MYGRIDIRPVYKIKILRIKNKRRNNMGQFLNCPYENILNIIEKSKIGCALCTAYFHILSEICFSYFS